LNGNSSWPIAGRATVFTDQERSYRNLQFGYIHQFVNLTNGIENFLSLLKKSINGTDVSEEAFHLDRYVEEQASRFNKRENKLIPSGSSTL